MTRTHHMAGFIRAAACIALLALVFMLSGCADDDERQVCAADGGGWVTRCGLPE